MDNVAFDVVIGLVFIYLLYSLYATVFIEIITTLFNLRAKNLYYSLARMLKDEKHYSNYFLVFCVELFTTIFRFWGTSINFKNHGLFDRVVNQPTIKYQTSGGLGNKPAYLTAESFSKALIDAIKVDNPDASLLACIEEGLLYLPDNSDTKKHILSLLDDANFDLIKFRILLENWFNETQDRAAGWFKQTTQVLLVFIGLILVYTFNLDTLAIINKLSTDKDARNNIVQMAIAFSEKNSNIKTAEPKQPLGDSVDMVLLRQQMDSLTAVRHMLEEDIKNSQNILASNWNLSEKIFFADSGNVLRPPNYRKAVFEINCKSIPLYIHNSVDQHVLQKILTDDSSEMVENDKHYLLISPWKYKLCFIFSEGRFWGYLLTVIAIAIGSPFWFDLLNKLVKLRSSNSVSSDSNSVSPSTELSNRGILNRVG